MKKLKYIFPLILICTCFMFLSACKLTTTYISPTVTVNTLTDSNVEKGANKALLSVVSIYTEAETSESKVLTMGSGVIYQMDKTAGDAYIITNYHIVYDSSYITPNHLFSQLKVELYGSEGTQIVTNNNKTTVTYGEQAITASFIGGSLDYDLAVLKITNSEVLKNSAAQSVEISKAPAHVAQTVITIGNPLGQQISVTTGIVSKESEYVKYSDFENVIVRCIRIDAPINSGNSGGGLFDANGNLLGIVNAGDSDAENIGSALPVPLVTNICDNIIFGYTSNMYTGLKKYNVGIKVYGANSKAYYDKEEVLEDGTIQGTGLVFVKEDVLISSLQYPASNKNLHVGDKIVSIQIGDDQIAEEDREKLELSHSYEFEEFLFKLRPGMKLYVTVVTEMGTFTEEITPLMYQS